MKFALVLIASGFMLAMLGAAQTPTSTSAEGERIHAEVTVAASRDDIWRAWTSSEGIATFFARDNNVELRLGGPFEMLFDTTQPKGQEGSNGCTFLSYLPGEMLSFTWNAPPKFAHARQHFTWVVLQFDSIDASSTKVTLDHLGWEQMKREHPSHAAEWNQVREYFAKAWPYVLNNLKRRFDEGPRWNNQGEELWK